MKPSDDLFLLIKSLKQSEKRHFKLYSSQQKGDKNYLRLFDAIDKQKIYDEEKIRKVFSGSPFINHLPWEKNNLYKLVLKSLRTYHSGMSVESEIMDLIRSAQLLFEKSLPDQSRKLLAKARKVSYLYKQDFLIPIITRLEFKIQDMATIEQSLTEEDAALDRLKNINGFRKILMKLFSIHIEMYQARDSRDMKALDTIYDSFLASEHSAFSFEAKLYQYQAGILLFDLRSDPLKAYEYRKKYVQLIEDNPKQYELLPRRYLTALNNLCLALLKLKRFKEIPTWIHRMKNLAKKSTPEYLHMEIFVYTLQINSDLYLCTGEFKKGLKLIREIQSLLEKYPDKIHRHFMAILYFNIAYLYFGAEDYGKSIKWLSKLFADLGDTREDLQRTGRIVNLIAYYESDPSYPLEPLIKSTYRFLHRQNGLYQFETVALNYIKKLSRVKNTTQLPNIYKAFKRELIALEKRDPFERQVIRHYFDLISWLESKIVNRPFAEIVKENFKTPSTF